MYELRHFFKHRQGWVAVLTWAVVSFFVLYVLSESDARFSSMTGIAVALQLLYLVAMAMVGAGPSEARRSGIKSIGLWAMVAAALVMGAILPIDFLPIYTIVWIAFTPRFMSKRGTYIAVAGVMLAWYLINTLIWNESGALISAALYGTFHFFALFSARQTQQAEEARERVESLNRELVATQHLLGEASRQSERTRIARDLHDLLGHHLTALTINLQVAERVSEGEARERIGKCHQLSRNMLDDVRTAVTTLRDESAMDFTRALHLLVDNIPQLRIDLEMDESLRIDDVNVAQSLLRCVQEAITNTLRHAAASACTVRVWREQGRLHLSVHDNGRIAPAFTPGNGLRGMRERVEHIHGELTLERVRDALRIHIQIPLAN